MGELDTKLWIDAARTYARLRHRAWLATFGYVGTFVGFVIGFFYATANNWDALAGSLFLVFVPISCILGLAMLFAWLKLRGFRCPRCRHPFALSLSNGWPTNKCKHCELDLGRAAVAKAKSTANSHLLE